jgi:hypothetical protein
MARPGEHDARYSHDEDLRPPGKEGRPPRPATEPRGAEGSTRTPKTATDPATGEPNPPKGREPR